MTVSELTAEDAEFLLCKLYYKDENSDFFDEEIYKNCTEHWGELGYSLSSTYDWDPKTNTRVENVAGQDFEGVWIACVENVGGGEGDGERRFAVFSFADSTDTKYFRKDGYYVSFDGTTWDGDFREVTPQNRTVTFYE